MDLGVDAVGSGVGAADPRCGSAVDYGTGDAGSANGPMSSATRLAAPFAPWAQVVPDAPQMTVNDFLNWPDNDGYRYELVEGTLVRMAGSGKRVTRIGLRIGACLLDYVEARGLERRSTDRSR